jgi:hypothetical protein
VTGYEMVLLARAVEACGEFRHRRALHFIPAYAPTDAGWAVETWRATGVLSSVHWETFSGPSLADALTDLLNDLGVEVPEPPSAERVAEVARALYDADPLMQEGARYLADLYAREPQTVLALLEMA